MGLLTNRALVDNAERRGTNWGYAVEGHPKTESNGNGASPATRGDKQEQALFIAEVEHKVKTALSILHGWSITLDDRWDDLEDSTRREAVSVIRRTADKVVQQCQQVLEEARIGFATAALEPEVIDLVETVRQSVPDGTSTGRSIIVDAGEAVPVRAVPSAVSQIVGHLVDNAAKYSPEGTPVVVRTKGEGPWAVVEVVDRGVGLPEGQEQAIFEPFQRGPNSGQPGAGLGLFIVRRLAQMMGGSVSASRNSAGGSTFTVRLPASELVGA